MLDDFCLHHKILVGGETEDSLYSGSFIGAKSGPVNLSGVLLVGGGPADHSLDSNQRRFRRLGLGGLNSSEQRVDVLVVGGRVAEVNGVNIPPIGLVTGAHVLCESDVSVVLDRDLVRVVKDNKIAKLLMASKRGRLSGNTLLDVTVTGNHVDEVVKHRFADGCTRVQKLPLKTGSVRKAGC